MADTKTSALTELTALATDDELPIVDTDAVATKRVTTATLAAYAVSVATYSAGWPARPNAELVIWVATDVAATAPGAATGDDIVILAQDADLTAIAALTSAADKVAYATGAQTWALADFSAAGRALVDDADASAQRTTLGLGNAATLTVDADLATFALPASTTISSYGATLVDDADAAAALTTLGAVAQAQSVNAQTGTTYTLVAGDAGKLVSLSNGSAITLTLPQDSDATIAVGTYVDLYQLGAGQVTVAAGTGATLRTSGLTAKARAQYSRLGVQKVSANTWSLFGDLAAS